MASTNIVFLGELSDDGKSSAVSREGDIVSEYTRIIGIVTSDAESVLKCADTKDKCFFIYQQVMMITTECGSKEGLTSAESGSRCAILFWLIYRFKGKDRLESRVSVRKVSHYN